MQQEYISLPNAQVSWPKLKQDLEAIVSKKVGGVDALESLLESNDRWSNVQLPLTLLRNVLKKEKKEENFAEAQLPWLAEKALQVEELFKDYKLLVRWLQLQLDRLISLSHTCTESLCRQAS